MTCFFQKLEGKWYNIILMEYEISNVLANNIRKTELSQLFLIRKLLAKPIKADVYVCLLLKRNKTKFTNHK